MWRSLPDPCRVSFCVPKDSKASKLLNLSVFISIRVANLGDGLFMLGLRD